MKCIKIISGFQCVGDVSLAIYFKNCFNRNLLCNSGEKAFLPAVTICELSPCAKTLQPPSANFSVSNQSPAVFEVVDAAGRSGEVNCRKPAGPPPAACEDYTFSPIRTLSVTATVDDPLVATRLAMSVVENGFASPAATSDWIRELRAVRTL